MDAFMIPSEWEPDEDSMTTPDQLAFAAYEDAWTQRDESGRTSPEILIAALNARRVPPSAYAPTTRLHGVLFDSWDKGRRPRRMHPTILKYRLGKIPHGMKSLFNDPLPDHMRRPATVRRAGKLLGDDTRLAFSPTGTFAARIPAWFAAIEVDDDDDDRRREIRIWLDTAERPQQTPVMIGETLAGHVDLPQWAHEQLLGATKRGRRLVVMGDLRVKHRKDGTYSAKKVEVTLPERSS